MVCRSFQIVSSQSASACLDVVAAAVVVVCGGFVVCVCVCLFLVGFFLITVN